MEKFYNLGAWLNWWNPLFRLTQLKRMEFPTLIIQTNTVSVVRVVGGGTFHLYLNFNRTCKRNSGYPDQASCIATLYNLKRIFLFHIRPNGKSWFLRT